MPKIEPAVTQLSYSLPNGVSYIDLARDLSRVNRRLYRQGMMYVVQDIQLIISAGTKQSDVAHVSFATAGNSWIVHNAWKKGFRAWRNQVKEIKNGINPAMEGKWADFKVYLDDSQEDGTTNDPMAGDAAAYKAGEWDHSQLVFDDDGTEKTFKMHLIGSTNLSDTNEESAIGLIHEYNITRPIPSADEPNLFSTVSDSIYAKLLGTDEITDMMVDHVEDDNDQPPYDPDEYPGGHDNADAPVPVRYGTVTSNNGMSMVPGFVVPCGLIQVQTAEFQLDANNLYEVSSAPTIGCIITLAPGPYRGVLAQKMGQ